MSKCLPPRGSAGIGARAHITRQKTALMPLVPGKVLLASKRSCSCNNLALHHGGVQRTSAPGALNNGSESTRSRPFPGSASQERKVSTAAAIDTDHAGSSTTDRDGSNALSLANIRDALIKLEDTMIFSIVERSQFKSNNIAYESGMSRGDSAPALFTNPMRCALVCVSVEAATV